VSGFWVKFVRFHVGKILLSDKDQPSVLNNFDCRLSGMSGSCRGREAPGNQTPCLLRMKRCLGCGVHFGLHLDSRRKRSWLGGDGKCLNVLVDLVGFEPTTSSMPWKRAPNCATGPQRAMRFQYIMRVG
jgi:hypothetical protein